MLSDKIVSKRKFWFKKDNKVRMEYLQPSYYLLVINRKDIRIKDAQKENKVSGKNNKLFEQINKITVDCVKELCWITPIFLPKPLKMHSITAWSLRR